LRTANYKNLFIHSKLITGTLYEELLTFSPACVARTRLISFINKRKTLKPHTNQLSSVKAALRFTEQEQSDAQQPADAVAAMKHFCSCQTYKSYLRKVEQYEMKV